MPPERVCGRLSPKADKPTPKPKAAPAKPDPALISKSLETQAKVNQIQRRMNKAVAAERQRMNQIQSLLLILKQPKAEAEQIEKYEQTLKALEAQIQLIKARLEIARLPDKAAREARGEALNKELAELRKTEAEKTKALREEIAEVKKSVIAQNPAFKATLKPYCVQPGGRFEGVVPGFVNASFQDAFATYTWRDAKGKQIAWAQIRIRDKAPDAKTTKLIAGKYPITSQSKNSIWVWAGPVSVAFVMNQTEWQKPDVLQDAVRAFVDLDGLVRLTAEKK